MPRKSQKEPETWRDIAFYAAGMITAVKSVRLGSRRGQVRILREHTFGPLAVLTTVPSAGERSVPLSELHVLFNQGAITVKDDFSLNGISGQLRLHPEHTI